MKIQEIKKQTERRVSSNIYTEILQTEMILMLQTETFLAFLALDHIRLIRVTISKVLDEACRITKK